MASSILSLQRAVGNLKRASTCRFCSRSPLGEIHSHMQELGRLVCPSVVSLASGFSGSFDRDFQNSSRSGTGIFLDPRLIVTSAYVVGHVSTFYQSTKVEKSELDRGGSLLHKSEIGSTAAVTAYGSILKTRPLAVNFGSDVAVLEVLNPEGNFLSHCALAKSLPVKENILMAMFRGQELQFEIMIGNVRAVSRKTIRAKAPWPMEDELGWIEHDWFFFGGRLPPLGSILFNSREMVAGSISRLPGSPWFNLHGEVVGISSWEFRDDSAKFSVGFAVPLPCIKSIVEYAKMKGPEDPIVMDSWIDAHTISGI